MAHYDCSCCGEAYGISHSICDNCKAGNCYKAKEIEQMAIERPYPLINYDGHIYCFDGHPARFEKMEYGCATKETGELYEVSLHEKSKFGGGKSWLYDRYGVPCNKSLPRLKNGPNPFKKVKQLGIF